jgi:hypothetical protein
MSPIASQHGQELLLTLETLDVPGREDDQESSNTEPCRHTSKIQSNYITKCTTLKRNPKIFLSLFVTAPDCKLLKVLGLRNTKQTKFANILIIQPWGTTETGATDISGTI